jgi:hypothetical protein
MSSVDQAAKFNRQGEIYRKSLRDANSSHKEHVDNLKETTDTNMKNQRELYSKDRAALETDYKENLEGVRKDQAKALVDKNKKYVDAVDEQKLNFHETTKNNVNEWNRKFTDLKDGFSKNQENEATSNKNNREELKKNYDNSVKNIRGDATKELNQFKSSLVTKSGTQAADFRKERRDLGDQKDKVVNDLVNKNLRERNTFRADIEKETTQMAKTQKEEYLKQRNVADARFKKFSQTALEDQDNFQRDEISRVKESAENGLIRKSDIFSKRFKELDRQYNKTLRNMENKEAAEKISQGTINNEHHTKMRKMADLQHATEKKVIIKDSTARATEFSNKMTELTDSYQDSEKKLKIKTAGETSENNRAHNKKVRDLGYENRMNAQKLSHENELSIKYEKNNSEARAKGINEASNRAITNLKKDFNAGMNKALDKSQKDISAARQENIDEKKQLQERLFEQNSKQTAFLKKVYNEKVGKITNGFEKRIVELENQNQIIHQNSMDTIQAVKSEAKDEIDRRSKIAIQSAKDQVEIERRASSQREGALRTSLNQSQANFARRISSAENNHNKKLREVTRELTSQNKRDEAKFREDTGHNQRYFAREVERLKSASSQERSTLISQYEDRIKQMQEVYKEKLLEVKDFNGLQNS